MTVVQADPPITSWQAPDGVAARGTLVVVPGRGEHPGVYERFGRRLAADGYPVWAVVDPVLHAEQAREQIRAVLGQDGPAAPCPHVLVGSDAGALFAAGLVAGGAAAVDALVLAGLPTDAAALPATASWDDEVSARTACPTHGRRLGDDDRVRRGALAQAVEQAWFDRADPRAITVPVLGLHGADDPVSPLDGARGWYAGLPAGDLVTIVGGRHDALNDRTHRTAAATVVLFLERLRLGAELPPIALHAPA